MSSKIAFKEGYKYQLSLTESVQTSISPIGSINTEYIQLSPWGLLTIKEGYAWDGASGPTWDSKASFRGSLYHDALYQLMREGLLPQSDKAAIDRLFHDTCVEDGMWKVRAAVWLKGVQLFGASSCDPTNDRKVIYAP